MARWETVASSAVTIYDGNDGWVTDDEGVKALKIFARSSAVIDYQPFTIEGWLLLTLRQKYKM